MRPTPNSTARSLSFISYFHELEQRVGRAFRVHSVDAVKQWKIQDASAEARRIFELPPADRVPRPRLCVDRRWIGARGADAALFECGGKLGAVVAAALDHAEIAVVFDAGGRTVRDQPATGARQALAV